MTQKQIFAIAANEEAMDILKELENMLKEKVLYYDDIEEMSKERQTEIYHYCKLHATHKACLENLKQIRYAVSKIYFGW